MRVATRVSSKSKVEQARKAGSAGSWRRRKARALRLLPFVILIPFAIFVFYDHVDVTRMAALVAGLALFFFAGSFVQRGLEAEADYHERDVVAAPRPPRKIIGSVIAAVAGGSAAYGLATNVVLWVPVTAVSVLAACLLVYGRDPFTDKGVAPEVTSRTGIKTADVIEAITEAEAKIKEIETAASTIKGREIQDRLERIAELARDVLREIERDPRDLRRARKFLITYLNGARNVTTNYARQQHDVGAGELGANFRRVLETIEEVFAKQRQVLLANDQLDLDVQIEVLETQLKREGVV